METIELEKIIPFYLSETNEIESWDKWGFEHLALNIRSELKAEAIKWINNLRTNETYSPILIDKFPDTMKGSSIKGKWKDGFTTLAMEYGMIMILMEFHNITESDLNQEVK